VAAKLNVTVGPYPTLVTCIFNYTDNNTEHYSDTVFVQDMALEDIVLNYTFVNDRDGLFDIKVSCSNPVSAKVGH
jgi:hypothetical protein